MNKLNKIIGISSIVWGILYFLYKMFFPKSVYDFLGGDTLHYSSEELQQYKLGLENAISIIEIAFIVVLIIIFIFSIINLRKKNIKFFSISKSYISTGTMLILFGIIFHISGLLLLSCIFTFFSGLLTIMSKE